MGCISFETHNVYIFPETNKQTNFVSFLYLNSAFVVAIHIDSYSN